MAARNVPQKDRRALELTGARPLREVARHGHHIEMLPLGHRFDGVGLHRHGRPSEVHVGEVQDARHGAAAAGATAHSPHRYPHVWLGCPQLGDDRVGELIRARRAAQIARHPRPLANRRLERRADPSRPARRPRE